MSETRGTKVDIQQWMRRVAATSLPSTETEYPVGSKWRVTVPKGTDTAFATGDVFTVRPFSEVPLGEKVTPGTALFGSTARYANATIHEDHVSWLSPLTPEPPAPAACSCDMVALMRAGCTCGAIEPFQREVFLRRTFH